MPPTKYHVEIDYNLSTSQLQIRAGVPTIILSSILKKAESSKPELISCDGDVNHVIIDFDIISDTIKVRTDAQAVILRGIFVMAYSSINQNKILTTLKMQAALRGESPLAKRSIID